MTKTKKIRFIANFSSGELEKQGVLFDVEEDGTPGSGGQVYSAAVAEGWVVLFRSDDLLEAWEARLDIIGARKLV